VSIIKRANMALKFCQVSQIFSPITPGFDGQRYRKYIVEEADTNYFENVDMCD